MNDRDLVAHALTQAYRAVGAGPMRDMPFLNRALEVEVVGLRPWQGAWLGALVTPWSINVVMLPRAGGAWPRLRDGDERLVEFPAGTYRLLAGRVAGLGDIHSLSLFSPALEFADAESARIAAAAALDALLAAPPAQPLARRDFLAGRYGEGGGGPRR